MQVDPVAQVAVAQSSRFSSQLAPPQPLTHTQWKPPAEFWQVPPFLHGGGPWEVSHSSISSEQSHPAGVWRENEDFSWEPSEERHRDDQWSHALGINNSPVQALGQRQV